MTAEFLNQLRLRCGIVNRLVEHDRRNPHGTGAAAIQSLPKLLRLLGKGFFRLLAEDGPELRDDALKLQFP